MFRGIPLGGGLLGVATAVTAPLLWPLMTDLCWSAELKQFLLGGDSFLWVYDLYYSIGMTVALPVGLLSGLSLHHILKPFVVGFPGIAGPPWYYTSLPFLAAVLATCVGYYGTARIRGGGVEIEDFLWMKRLDPISGNEYSYNLRTKERRENIQVANSARMKIDLTQVSNARC